MSQAATEDQGQQNGQPAIPPGVAPNSAAAAAIQHGQEQAQAQQNATNDAGRAGGPEALKADLAKERQQRHTLEEQLKATNTALEQLKAGLGQALGVTPTQMTPEQMQAQAQQLAAQNAQAMTQLAVHQLANAAGGDPLKLLDSASFLASIKDIQPTDTAGITAAIKSAVEKNKGLAPTTRSTGAGSSDAGTTAGAGGQQPTISELLRAAAGK
jgi:hypothetical protein